MASNDDSLPTPAVEPDGERFVDDEVDVELPPTIDLPNEGSIADIIDQHRAVPDDDPE